MHDCIKVSRRVFHHPLFGGETFTKRDAWLWLIATAVFRPYRLKWNKHTVLLERGQLVASHAQMAKAWGWHVSKVRRFLASLEREGMIQNQAAAGAGIDSGGGTPPRRISVCNYDEYQLRPSDLDTPADTPADTHKNVGSKNVSPAERARTRETGQGHRLPDDWQPKDYHYQLGKELGFTTEQVDNEAARFCDYWHAEAGQRARKKDWDRGFNTWLRKSAEYGQRSAAGKQAARNGSGCGSLVAATRDLLSGCGD